jgi:hypothetical protein
MAQETLMKYDPQTGDTLPYPSHAKQYREYHGCAAWLINPWTGERRHAFNVGSDVQGALIHVSDEPLIAKSIEARQQTQSG